MRSLKPICVVLGLIATVGAASLPAQQAAQKVQMAARPDAAGAVNTYFAARKWLDTPNGAAVATPDDVHAAAVVLRLRGRVVGMGKDAGDAPRSGTVDRALQAALADAKRRPGVGGANEANAANDEIPIGSLLTLELELAGARQPLIGRGFEEIAKNIQPAECGLQLVDGTRCAYLPASYLLANRMASPVTRGLLILVEELGLPARDLPKLQELGGNTAVYAMRSIRFAQHTPQDTPVLLARLMPPVFTAAAPRAAGQDLCERISARLAMQLQRAKEAESLPEHAAEEMARMGLRGDYAATIDRYQPFAATPAEQALAAWALARAGATESWGNSLRIQAIHAARQILLSLANQPPSDRPLEEDPAAVAYAVMAMHEQSIVKLSDAPPLTGVAPSFTQLITAALDKFLLPAQLASLRPHVRAVLLDAAAVSEAAGTPRMTRDALITALSAEWKQADAQAMPAVAPFLIDAEMRLSNGEPARLSEWQSMLDAARTVLIGTQVRQAQADDDPSLIDSVGAYPMVGSMAGRISAQSTRAQVFVAMLAGMPATRSAARDDEDRTSLECATRFLQQLTASDSMRYCMPSPERALGGVLASPADAAQPVAAQAMAILALTESERALQRMAK